MPVSKPNRSTPWNGKASTQVARVAGAQWGVVGARQLRDLGVPRTTAMRWRERGWLHDLLPGVYAVGHEAVPPEGLLVAALLHAGPGAALSHATAAWWWSLIPDEPPRIEVSTTSRARSIPAVLVHHPRELALARHKRLPVTSVSCTLRDYATQASDAQVRRALSEADYLNLLDLTALHEELGKGRAGSTRLRRTLRRHEPRLARTRSRLERKFLTLCETYGIPLPEVNVRVGRMTVDALWRKQRVVVELDGHQGHRSKAQIDRDRRRELHLRAHGLGVVRYTEDQLDDLPVLIAADLSAVLGLEGDVRGLT